MIGPGFQWLGWFGLKCFGFWYTDVGLVLGVRDVVFCVRRGRLHPVFRVRLLALRVRLPAFRGLHERLPGLCVRLPGRLEHLLGLHECL